VDVDIRTVEHELCRIPEVNAARIVTSDDGRPTEVHILASPEKHAKQVVRDVQSVAMATFGLELDRRVISVVQLESSSGNGNGNGSSDTPDSNGGVDTDDHAPWEPRYDPTGPGEGHRIVVERVAPVRHGMTGAVEVELRRGSVSAVGQATGTTAAASMQRIVASATLDALRELEPGTARVDVESAGVVRIGDRAVAVVTVVVVVPPYEEVMAGAAVVRAAGEHDAIARAVLHAMNRRIGTLAAG
jgi:hypothetical protein